MFWLSLNKPHVLAFTHLFLWPQPGFCSPHGKYPGPKSLQSGLNQRARNELKAMSGRCYYSSLYLGKLSHKEVAHLAESHIDTIPDTAARTFFFFLFFWSER